MDWWIGLAKAGQRNDGEGRMLLLLLLLLLLMMMMNETVG